MPERERTGASGLLNQLPTDRLVEQGQQLLALMAELAIEKAVGSVENLAGRLIDYGQHGGPGLITAIAGGAARTTAKLPLGATVKAGITGVSESAKQAISAVTGPRKNGRVTKPIGIVEQIDVDVPVRLAYDQWSQFQEFSQFMKKVSAVEKTSDETSSWTVQVLRSHRDWEATIIEQIPDQRIAWRSDGAKCRVDGAVSFHAVTPNMTRILVVLEYYPWGLLERTGNLWHAQARRVRLEINKFRRHIMTRAVLNPDSVQGWRGEIRDSKVVRTHEEAIAAEAEERQEPGESQEQVPASDASAQDDLDTVEKDNRDIDDMVEDRDKNDNNVDAMEEHDDYDDNVDDSAAEHDGDYDDPDEDYEEEPEREAARSGRR